MSHDLIVTITPDQTPQATATQDRGVIDKVTGPDYTVITLPDGTVIGAEVDSGQSRIRAPIIGIAGPSGVEAALYTAGATVTAFQAVYMGSDNLIYPASSDDLTHAYQVLGITLNATDTGGGVVVVDEGFVENTLWNFTPNKILFLGLSGAVTTDSPEPPTNLFVLIVGRTITSTKIHISIEVPYIHVT